MLRRQKSPYEFSMFLDFNAPLTGQAMSFDLSAWVGDRTWQTRVARGWAWIPVRHTGPEAPAPGGKLIEESREIVDFDVLVDPWEPEGLSLRLADDSSTIMRAAGLLPELAGLGWFERRRYWRALRTAAATALELSGNVERFRRTFAQEVRRELAWMEARAGLFDDEQLRILREVIEGLPAPGLEETGNVIDAADIFSRRGSRLPK